MPCAPAARSITGVAVMPMVGSITSHTCGNSLATVSPAGTSETFHSWVPVSASNAYAESFSVATNTTLCLTPPMLSADRYSGCASTLPSVLRNCSLPKLACLTFAGVRVFSLRFCPVRARSFL